MQIHLKKQFRFEASHQLPNHDGKCARLHGHSWVLEVWVKGEVSTVTDDAKEGMVMDYAYVKDVITPIIELLDHAHLGHGFVHNFRARVQPDHQKFVSAVELFADYKLQRLDFPIVPTSENILIWIADQLVKNHPHFDWQCLCLQETCTSEARLYAQDYAAHHAALKFKESQNG